MSKGKVAVLLLTVLVLSLGVISCGFTSQGTQEQNRPAENQNPPEEDSTEAILKQQEHPNEQIVRRRKQRERVSGGRVRAV